MVTLNKAYFRWVDQSHIAVELEVDETQQSGVELQKGGHYLEINIRWILELNPLIIVFPDHLKDDVLPCDQVYEVRSM